MAKNLNSSPPFIGTPLLSLRHGFLHSHRRLVSTRVKLSFHKNLPPINSFDSHIDFSAILTRTEGLLYTLADAAVAAAADAAVQKKQRLVRVHIRRHGGRSQGNEGWTNSCARAIRVRICDNITCSISIDKATGTVDRSFLLDSLSGCPNFNRCPTKWIWHFLAFSVCGGVKLIKEIPCLVEDLEKSWWWITSDFAN